MYLIQVGGEIKKQGGEKWQDQIGIFDLIFRIFLDFLSI